MKAYDAASKEILKSVAERMPLKPDDFAGMLQLVYDLGMQDGQLKALRERIDREEQR